MATLPIPVPDRPAGFFMDWKRRSLYGRDYSKFGASGPEMAKHEALIRKIGLTYSNPDHVTRANDSFIKSLLRRQMQRQKFQPSMSGLLKYTPTPIASDDAGMEKRIKQYFEKKKKLATPTSDTRTRMGLGSPSAYAKGGTGRFLFRGR
jgi:hypothetical protein